MLEVVQRDAGADWEVMERKWGGADDLNGCLVFCCVDNMRVRRDVLESMNHGLFIEVRMGVKHGMVFTIDAAVEEEREFWLSHWVDDKDLKDEVSACGTSLTIGSTALLLSSLAAWQSIHFLNKCKLQKKLTACVEPYIIMGE